MSASKPHKAVRLRLPQLRASCASKCTASGTCASHGRTVPKENTSLASVGLSSAITSGAWPMMGRRAARGQPVMIA